MEKLQKRRVQEVPFQNWQGRLFGGQLDLSRCAVEGVTDHGMPDRAKVHPDLMRSACLDRKLEQREATKAFYYFVLRMRLASMGGSRGHAQAVNAVASDGAVNFSGRLLHPAVYQRPLLKTKP